VLLKLKEKYPSLIIEKELKPGACATRNKGLNIAKGEWIQFLDADDLIEKTKIEHQVGLIMINKCNLDFIAGASLHINSNGYNAVMKINNVDAKIAPFLNQCGNTCSNLWRREKLLEVNLWDESLSSSQEADLMMRLILKCGRFIIDNTPLTIIRQREQGQISQSNPMKRWVNFIEIRLNFINELKKVDYKCFKKHQGVMNDFLINSILMLSKINIANAEKYFNLLVTENWLSKGEFGIKPWKRMLIRFLGFRNYCKFFVI
jgi:glycosyltransferase involved in cell wall biosynthesis